VKVRNFPTVVPLTCKVGYEAARKKDKTLKAILKRKVLKYPMMTTAELLTIMTELQVAF
jgi:hypothetical protein